MSFGQQMGNIASEIARAKHWDKAGDLASRAKALERAIELVDLTVESKRDYFKLRELLRLREILGDLLVKSDYYNVSWSMLENYCLSFLSSHCQVNK